MISVLPGRLALVTGRSPQIPNHFGSAPRVEALAHLVSFTIWGVLWFWVGGASNYFEPRSRSLIAIKNFDSFGATVYVHRWRSSTLASCSKILPRLARSAAPPRKLEYGAFCFSRDPLPCRRHPSLIFAPCECRPPHNSRDDSAFKQPITCPFTRSAGFQNFQIVEAAVLYFQDFPPQHSSRRDAQHANAAMRRHHFRDRGHTPLYRRRSRA